MKNLKKKLGHTADSIVVQEGFVIVAVNRGFCIWNTEGEFLNHIVKRGKQKYWVHDTCLHVLNENKITDFCLDTFKKISEIKPPSDCFEADATFVYHKGVLNVLYCRSWEIFTNNHLFTAPHKFGSISARWNDERLIIAVNRKGSIFIHDRLRAQSHPIRETGINDITQIERISKNFFLLISNTITEKDSEGNIYLWDLESNSCIKDFKTGQKKTFWLLKHNVNSMVMPLTAFDGREMVISFWNRDRNAYVYKVFDFTRLANEQPQPQATSKPSGLSPSISI